MRTSISRDRRNMGYHMCLKLTGSYQIPSLCPWEKLCFFTQFWFAKNSGNGEKMMDLFKQEKDFSGCKSWGVKHEEFIEFIDKYMTHITILDTCSFRIRLDQTSRIYSSRMNLTKPMPRVSAKREMSSVQNPSLILLYWLVFVGIPLLGYEIILHI